MPKSKEFVDSDSESQSGSEDEKPKKKQKIETKKPKKGAEKEKQPAASSKGASSSNAGGSGETMINLGKKKFATVSEFRGTKYVNIREYYGDDGDLKPGKKGIALSVEQWNQLKSSASEIDAALEAL